MIGDTARLLGLSTSRVRQLAEQGKIATLRTPGGVRLFAREDVETLRNLRAAEASGTISSTAHQDGTFTPVGDGLMEREP